MNIFAAVKRDDYSMGAKTMIREITFEMLTTDQLKGLLDVRDGKNLEYDLWRELHKMELVTFDMIEGAPLQDVLTDKGLELIGVLTK